MKRYLLLSFVLIGINGFAQQQAVLKNKRGIAVLPQKGNYCIGVNASPFLSYLGNLFNNTNTSNTPTFSFANGDNSLYGKYMKTNNTAYRAGFRVAMNNVSYTYNVIDLSPGAAQNALVSDVLKRRSKNISLSFGVEKRKGNTRIQGFYGCEGFIGYSSTKDKYDYGNKLENLDTGTRRVKEIKSNASFSIGLRGFVGVEYFIAPNFSIGGELGYGPRFVFSSANRQSVEQYDFTTSTATLEEKDMSPKTQSLSLDTDNASGNLKLLFYF